MCFFKAEHYYGHISGMVDPMWHEKERYRLDNRYNMLHWPLTSFMTLTLDISRYIRNSCISGIAGLIDVTWKVSELIGYWAECMTLLFVHTHGLHLEVLKSEFEIALSRRGCDSSIHDHEFLRHIRGIHSYRMYTNEFGEVRHWGTDRVALKEMVPLSNLVQSFIYHLVQ